MALKDTWHRALVYFGLAEDHDYGPEYEEDFEPETGTEYTFPVRVIARVIVGLPSMSVVFDGVPSETRALGRATSGVVGPAGYEEAPREFEEDEVDTAKMSQL